MDEPGAVDRSSILAWEGAKSSRRPVLRSAVTTCRELFALAPERRRVCYRPMTPGMNPLCPAALHVTPKPPDGTVRSLPSASLTVPEVTMA